MKIDMHHANNAMSKKVKFMLIFFDKEYRKMCELVLSDFLTCNIENFKYNFKILSQK